MPQTTQPHVLIYSSPVCVYCKMEKAFLKEHEISFDDINVLTDPARYQEMVQVSSQQGTPVTVITEGDNEEIIIGFDQPALEKALHLENVQN